MRVPVVNLVKIGLAFCLASLIVGAVLVGGLFWHFSHGLPDHKQLADYQPATVSRLYASDGRLLAEYAREKRVFVPVAAMPKRVLEAFVAAEDQRFFTHPGIDALGVIRAAVANISNPGRRPEGASGITAILGEKSEPMTDLLLRLLPECGGQSRFNDRQ